jgi:hypothetical protein
MRCVGHVAHRGEMRNAHKILARKSKRKRPFGKLDICERVILRWISRK